MRRFKQFWRAEGGAVTIEWVVLTAAVATLALAVGNYLDGSVSTELKQKIDSSLSNGKSQDQ
jgi:Flp pilus assembly pilin Flp